MKEIEKYFHLDQLDDLISAMEYLDSATDQYPYYFVSMGNGVYHLIVGKRILS